MGLKLRLNLFHQVAATQVFDAYTHFYAEHGQQLVNEGKEHKKFILHELDNDWVILSLDGGWEWDMRRKVQLFVSRQLDCIGFLIFVYDGDYWGYEFFNDGVVLDQFVQDPDEGRNWFTAPNVGQPEVLHRHLPWLALEDIVAYLVQMPQPDLNSFIHRKIVHEMYEGLNVPARPGDEFKRFDECAVLDFLRILNVRVELQDRYESGRKLPHRYVTFFAPIHRTFWIQTTSGSG
jgi:hypothetical protein